MFNPQRKSQGGRRPTELVIKPTSLTYDGMLELNLDWLRTLPRNKAKQFLDALIRELLPEEEGDTPDK